MLDLEKISLDELAKTESLDDRTIIVCKHNMLNDMHIIMQYYLTYNDFKKLRLVNEYTNKKLTTICEKYNTCSLKSTLSTHTDENIKGEDNITIENYSLSKLADIESLSVRVINVCKRYDLTDLQKILHYYYVKKGSFDHLHNCGQKSIEELSQLCEKYRKKFVIYSDTKLFLKNNIRNKFPEIVALLEAPIIILINHENVSNRSHNVCIDNNLTDIQSIIAFYWTHRSFTSLRNCGQKSNLELINLSKKYEIYFEQPNELLNKDRNPSNPIIDKVNSLTIKQKQIINNLLVARFNDLSVRSKNALNSYLGHDITLKNLISSIFSDTTFNVNNIRNVGEKSKVELNILLEGIQEQIEIASNYQDESEIELKLLKTFLIKNFSLNEIIINKVLGDLDLSNGLPIFKVIKALVDNDIIFEQKEKYLFYSEFCSIEKKDFKSLNQLSLKLGITRERVRQIRKQFLTQFDSYFKFLTNYEIKSLINYNLDLTSIFIDIPDDLINRIRDSEGIQFNNLLIIRIFAILYGDKFDIIGNLSRNLNIRDYQTDNWEKSYLVDNKIKAIFNFNEFYDDIKSRLSNKIEEDYCFNFQSYLLSFFLSSNYERLDEVFEIAEYILLNEFELCLDVEENIVFMRNTKKQINHSVIDILKEVKKPLTINEIYDIIEKKYPGLTKSPESLRASCQRDPNLVYFGKGGTYGLKMWENELQIKGGTIRDIAEGFLQEQANPIHINKITKYLRKYRNTNYKSVYNNLKLDDRKRFTFYSGQLIGLASKKYNGVSNLNNDNIDRKTWEERFLSLQKFTKENNRLPLSSGGENEVKLYRFLRLQFKKTQESKAYDSKLNNLIELVSRYNYKIRSKGSPTESINGFKDLKEFIKNNNRFPNSRKESERILYVFYYRQKKLYQSGKLSRNLTNKYLEIEELKNQIK